MKLPKKIIFLLIFLLLLGIIGSINIMNNFVNIELLILTFTLVALIAYVYYTYLIAKEAWTPIASFSFRQFENDPFHIQYIVTNHCKFTLETWGELVAKIDGKKVSLDGFYGKQHHWILQPLTTGFGHFELKGLAEKAGKTLEELEKTNENIKFSFVLTYKSLETGEEKKTETQNYCFDFKNKQLSLDV